MVWSGSGWKFATKLLVDIAAMVSLSSVSRGTMISDYLTYSDIQLSSRQLQETRSTLLDRLQNKKKTFNCTFSASMLLPVQDYDLLA